jgi:hypothetical protein
MLPLLIKFKFKFKSSFRSTFDRARLTVYCFYLATRDQRPVEGSSLEQNTTPRSTLVAHVHEMREDRGRPSERRFKEAQSAILRFGVNLDLT